MKNLLLLFLTFTVHSLSAQTAESIIDGLKSINSSVSNAACNTGKGNIISNRAMNIFLANKTGTYLSGDNDLSLYKNSITFNTTEGTFSVLHNLRQAKGMDEPVKSSVFIGARANVLSGFEALSDNNHFINDFGLLTKKVWMGKTNTSFNKCISKATMQSQKQNMDALRASILNLLAAEIKQKDSLFENSLRIIDTAQVPGQNLDSVKVDLRTNFYINIKEEYSRKFAELQSETLIETNNYNLITANWTSLGAYIPLLREKYYVASSLTSNFKNYYLYPVEIFLTHTRFWESSKYGRFFLKLNAKVCAGNAYHSKTLQTISITDYKAAGGTDTLQLPQQNSNTLFIGRYRNFITPQLSAAFVYFPPAWHLGVSGFIEQNIGNYRALNGKIGLPVVLIDKKGYPDITFEFQVLFFDIPSKVQPAIKLSDKTSVGFSIGVPFSKIVY